jgi:uncharacterized YigZ family protein
MRMSNRSTLLEPASAQQEIKKSRFIAQAAQVGSEEDAKAMIATLSYVDAGHNCWAWRIGQQYRFSDDGEPTGTAGKPILAAIDGQTLDNVCVVVARWFGGILLGSGGLVRAYGGTAALCLRGAQLVELIETVDMIVPCPFADLSLLQSRIAAWPNAKIQTTDFTATGADITVAVPKEDVARFARIITDLTSGRVEPILID